MKTLKFFIVLCFIAAFAANNVNAQNKVIKQQFTFTIGPWYCPCTDEYLIGDLTFDFMIMSHNEIARLRDGIMYGYDENGIQSGNVYECSQLSPGTYSEESPSGIKWYVNTVLWRLDGKLISEAHYDYRFVINGKDVIIFERGETVKWNCK